MERTTTAITANGFEMKITVKGEFDYIIEISHARNIVWSIASFKTYRRIADALAAGVAAVEAMDNPRYIGGQPVR